MLTPFLDFIFACPWLYLRDIGGSIEEGNGLLADKSRKGSQLALTQALQFKAGLEAHIDSMRGSVKGYWSIQALFCMFIDLALSTFLLACQ